MKKSLAELYRQHRQGLFTLALSITRSRQAAEDAIHDVFARLCRKPLLVDDPAAYVFAAVRNAARDFTTRRKFLSDTPLDLFDPHASAESPAESRELAEFIQQCLMELDDHQRDAVVLKIWSDLTFEQIAAITNEPLQTIASRYRRALQRLKELIGTRV